MTTLSTMALTDNYNILGMKSFKKTIKVLKQKGRSNALRDESRSASMPGKRVSRTGKVYWETRKNRSDMPGKTI